MLWPGDDGQRDGEEKLAGGVVQQQQAVGGEVAVHILLGVLQPMGEAYRLIRQESGCGR